jgi:heptosyltransferase II
MRILVEVPSWLGDTVMASPAIENLINYYKESKVILIGPFLSIETLKNHPKIFGSYVIQKKYSSLYKVSKKLGKFDIFISFRNSFRSRFFKYWISSNKKFHFDKNKYQNCHQVQKYNDFINDSIGTQLNPGKLIIHPSFKQDNKSLKPIMGINPGSSYGGSKRWQPEEFAKVIVELSHKFEILIFGGFAEINIANDIEKLLIENNISNYKNLVNQTSIEELIKYISTLDMFLTGDSGPMHIAAAFNVPTVAIFGPTKDYETSQWMNDKSNIVKKNLDCQPCMKRECPLKHNNCMRLIKAEEVLNSVKSLI